MRVSAVLVLVLSLSLPSSISRTCRLIWDAAERCPNVVPCDEPEQADCPTDGTYP
jgi:hypothetical protein